MDPDDAAKDAEAKAKAKEEAAKAKAFQLVAGKINAVLGNGDFIPQVEAERITKDLRENHRKELLLFLEEHIYRLIFVELRRLEQKEKQRARSAAVRCGEALKSEDPDALSAYLEEMDVLRMDRYRVDDENTQRAAFDMVGKDWLFSANESGQESKYAAREELFKRYMAKKVGSRKTGDVLTNEEYVEIRRRMIDG